MWLAHCMERPLRCPGLSYNANMQLITPSGRLWDDVVAEQKAKDLKNKTLFWDVNKKHLEDQGHKF